MISVGSRDGMKGLGFDVGRTMEENEVEEGEACSYRNEDARNDPDVGLSYIGEKLHDLLGYLQKDFEGEVSAENLGAKFGGYGSFLPAYQRSPALSHTRTPPRTHNYSIFESPKSSQLEGGYQNSLLSTSAHLLRHDPIAANIVTVSARISPSLHNIGKRDVHMRHAEAFDHRSENGKKCVNPPQQKPLKVRIKMGAGNLSAQNNAAIYCGLGLDVSPTSSLEDSQTESEGLSRASEVFPNETPNSILQIMTFFPIHGDLLLSPLPDDLIHLKMKEKPSRDSKCGLDLESGFGNSVMLINGPSSIQDERKVLGQKKIKPEKKKNISFESQNVNDKDCQSGSHVSKNKKAEIDSLACEELVSKALKLPLMSNSYGYSSDLAKHANRVSDVSSEVIRDIVTDRFSSDKFKDEALETIPRIDDSDAIVCHYTKGDAFSIDMRQDYHQIIEKKYASVKADSNAFNGRKATNGIGVSPLKLKSDKKKTFKEQTSMLQPAGKEHPSFRGQKEIKGSKSHDLKVIKEPSGPKSNKGAAPEINLHKNESENLRLPKNSGNTRDMCTDLFGDTPLEQEEKKVDLVDCSFKDEVNCSFKVEVQECDASENHQLAFNNGPKEILGEQKIERLPNPERYRKAAPFTGNWPVSDAAPPTVSPVENNDNWVACDTCQKWRLLPVGTDPDSLPEKWLCYMTDWLPGMNLCSVSEEETTKLVIALNQASQNQNNLQIHPDGILSGLTTSGVRYPDQNSQQLNIRSAPSDTKKKNEMKEIIDQDDSAQFPDLMKDIPLSMQRRDLNDANQLPDVNEISVQHLQKSSDSAVAISKKKDTYKLNEQFSDGGNTKNLKLKSKRPDDQDSFGASKKTKKEEYIDHDQMPEHGGVIRKAGPSSSNGMPTDVPGKDQPDHKYDLLSNDSKSDGMHNYKVSIIKSRDQDQVSFNGNTLVLNASYTKDLVAKKRKVTEFEHSQVCAELSAKEQTSENDFRKEKKARVPKYDGKNSIVIKGSNSKPDKKVSAGKDEHMGQDLENSQSQQSLDGMDYLKRDFGSSQTLAATSSSSKVSCSYKSKTNFHVMKGSPVESVSSSPLKISNIDNVATGRMNLSGYQESNEVEMLDRGFSHLSDNHTKEQKVTSPEVMNGHFLNGNADISGQLANKCQASDRSLDDGRRNENHYHASGSHSKPSGKASSSRSKDKIQSSKSHYDKRNITDSLHTPQDHTLVYEGKTKDGKSKFREKCKVDSHKNEKKNSSKRDPGMKLSDKSNRRANQSKSAGYGGPDVKVDSNQDEIHNPKHNLIHGHDGEKSSKLFKSDKTDRSEVVSIRGRSVPLPPSGREKNDTEIQLQQNLTVSPGGKRSNILSVDAPEGDKALRGSKQDIKAESENGGHPINSRLVSPTVQRVRDRDAPSPVRRDSSTQAATNAMKEAKDLKHLADRLKNNGASHESTGLYFQAALKFLHSASLFENCNNENSKNVDQSMQTYSSTAKFCEFCAHEFERSKDMAAAALAYKCMEVAYMRVISSSHSRSSRDHHELYNALQIVPPGESPSSSASDLDNLNTVATADKDIGKGVCSPQVTGSHTIAARYRPSFVRLLNYAQDVNLAMEASRKSRFAFGMASASMEATQHKEITLVRRALDFNFHDVEGLIGLVRVAIEAISR